MNKTRKFVLLTLMMVASLWALLEYRIYANSSRFLGGIGPDVIVGNIPGISRWGTLNGETSFSIGTTSCNIGDEPLLWQANTPQHPVITQNLYRVSQDGRFEQLGRPSWLKHGFAVAAGNYCGQCTDFSSVRLGVNCSDPYSSGLNGQQGGLGPRSEINATTGVFPMPYRRLSQPRNVLDGRISVDNSDLDPAQNPGANYYVESQYIHPQDAQAGNDDNNASYRKVNVSLNNGIYNLNPSGQTVREQAAISVWQDLHPDVRIIYVDVPDDGRFIVGILTTPGDGDLGGFHTEIAIQNFNSHRSMRSLGVKFGSNSITNAGFHDVEYQQESYAGNDWAPVINGNEIEWSTDTYDTDQNANALRWSTVYSYWCDSDACPTELTLGLFRPGTPTEVTIDISAPYANGGTLVEGFGEINSFGATCGSDDVYWAAHGATFAFQVADPVTQFELTAAAPAGFGGSSISVDIEASKQSAKGNLNLIARIYNFTTDEYVSLPGVMPLATSDSVQNFALAGGSDPADFIEPGTDEVRVLLQTLQTSGLANVRTQLDDVRFNFE